MKVCSPHKIHIITINTNTKMNEIRINKIDIVSNSCKSSTISRNCSTSSINLPLIVVVTTESVFVLIDGVGSGGGGDSGGGGGCGGGGGQNSTHFSLRHSPPNTVHSFPSSCPPTHKNSRQLDLHRLSSEQRIIGSDSHRRRHIGFGPGSWCAPDID